MKTNENGNVVLVGYFYSMVPRNDIESYRLCLQSKCCGTYSDYFSGKIRVQYVTMLESTPGAFELSLKYPENCLVAIEFKINGPEDLRAVSVRTIEEDSLEKLEYVTVDDEDIRKRLKKSEREKQIMHCCEIKARGFYGGFNHPDDIVPKGCIKDGKVNRRYGIQTEDHGGNNYGYYAQRTPRTMIR